MQRLIHKKVLKCSRKTQSVRFPQRDIYHSPVMILQNLQPCKRFAYTNCKISIENESSIEEKLNLSYPFDWKSQGEIILGTDGLKKQKANQA